MQLSGNVRRRDDNGVRFFLWIRICPKASVFIPHAVNTIFKIMRLVGFCQFFFHMITPFCIVLCGSTNNKKRPGSDSKHCPGRTIFVRVTTWIRTGFCCPHSCNRTDFKRTADCRSITGTPAFQYPRSALRFPKRAPRLLLQLPEKICTIHLLSAPGFRRILLLFLAFLISYYKRKSNNCQEEETEFFYLQIYRFMV